MRCRDRRPQSRHLRRGSRGSPARSLPPHLHRFPTPSRWLAMPPIPRPWTEPLAWAMAGWLPSTSIYPGRTRWATRTRRCSSASQTWSGRSPWPTSRRSRAKPVLKVRVLIAQVFKPRVNRPFRLPRISAWSGTTTSQRPASTRGWSTLAWPQCHPPLLASSGRLPRLRSSRVARRHRSPPLRHPAWAFRKRQPILVTHSRRRPRLPGSA